MFKILNLLRIWYGYVDRMKIHVNKVNNILRAASIEFRIGVGRFNSAVVPVYPPVPQQL